MEAVEFLRNYNRMCSTIDKCSECPAVNMKCCELSTYEQAKLVEIVEKWAKEHPDGTEQEQQKPEQNDAENHRTTPNELSIEDRVGILEQNMRIVQNFRYEGVVRVRHGHWKRYEDCGVTRCSVCDYSVEEYIEFRYCPYCGSKMDESVDEPKRMNKDVLLAAFPNAFMDDNGIPYACPYRLDAHYNCDKFEDCLRCRHTHWLAEVEK